MRILISSIIVPPRQKPLDEDPEFNAEIAKNGIKRPVLVTQDAYSGSYLLVDGLRRLAALHALSRLEAPALVAHTYEEACLSLKAAHSNHILTIRRIYEIYQTLVPLARKRQKREAGVTRTSRRELFYDALGLGGRFTLSELSALIQLYRARDLRGDPVITRFVKALEDGALSPHAARQQYSRIEYGDHRVGQRNLRIGSSEEGVVKAADQRQIITTALATLSGVTKGLCELGLWDTQILHKELATWAKELSAQRFVLSRVIKSMRSSTPPPAEDGALKW